MADQHKNHQVMITSRQRHNGPSDTNGEEYSMDGVVITRDTVWTESRQNNDAV
jgi:hypothetical protein